jgi:GMP synthase (glutamine-hydrolysing)
MGIPILGICYGCHLMTHLLGGTVSSCITAEYGKTETFYDKSSVLLGAVSSLPAKAVSWMSHGDYIEKLPEGFKVTAHTADCPTAAVIMVERITAIRIRKEVTDDLPDGGYGVSRKEAVRSTVPPGG